MELHIFKAHKQGIAESMRENLIFSKAVGRPVNKHCTKYYYQDVHITSDIQPSDLRTKLELIQDLMDIPNAEMKMKGHTRASGRYDMFDGITMSAKIPEVRDFIDNSQIENIMRDLVKKELKKSIDGYFDINCQVMALYKEGTINWDEVVKTHKEECSL